MGVDVAGGAKGAAAGAGTGAAIGTIVPGPGNIIGGIIGGIAGGLGGLFGGGKKKKTPSGKSQGAQGADPVPEAITIPLPVVLGLAVLTGALLL